MLTVRHFLCLPLLVCLASCGAENEKALLPGADYSSARTFGPEERRAANALSVGAIQSQSGGDDPYKQATSCVIALETLAERLSDVGALDDRGMAELRRVLANFEAEARRLGAAAGKSGATIEKDREIARDAESDLGARAQLGIGCLRKSMISTG